MTKRIFLIADEGKVLTDGEIYGTEIILAEGVDESAFYQITREEYEKIIESRAEQFEAGESLV